MTEFTKGIVSTIIVKKDTGTNISCCELVIGIVFYNEATAYNRSSIANSSTKYVENTFYENLFFLLSYCSAATKLI